MKSIAKARFGGKTDHEMSQVFNISIYLVHLLEDKSFNHTAGTMEQIENETQICITLIVKVLWQC